MTVTSLLSHAQLSVISAPVDGEIATIASRVQHSAQVGGREELEALFCDLLAETTPAIPPQRTLDLIGHSTPDECLLRLGTWVIDGSKRSVVAFFRELADLEIMQRLGIRAVRLLGCETATTIQGRSTICTLSEILGIDVLGTRAMVTASYYTPHGYGNDFVHALVSASELAGSQAPSAGAPYQRTLDVGELPASPLAAKTWPLAVATTEQARELVQLIGRNDGAFMPHLSAIPQCEVALPSTTKPSWFHSLQIVLDGAFVRAFPDAHGPGVVFPVRDPDRMRAIVRSLAKN